MPVERIEYSFDLDEFPTLEPRPSGPKDTDPAARLPNSTTTATAPTADSTKGAPTSISAITEDLISHTVKTQFDTLNAQTQAQQKDLQSRMDDLDKQLLAINSRIDAISDRLANKVIDTLTAEDGILTKHARKLDAQVLATNKIMDTLTELATSVQRITQLTDKITAEDSPLRKKKRRGGSILSEGDSTDTSESNENQQE